MPGIYVDEKEWRALPAWERYLAKIHAVHRKRPDAIFVAESAAALHGIPFIGRPRFVHILAHNKGAARTTGIVRAHFSIENVSPIESGGMLMTNAIDTVYRLHSGGSDAAIIAEKRREDAIRRRVEGFARWGWADCVRPERLERIIAERGVPRVAPRNSTRLRTLATLLRGHGF